jgi:hypothetical protein
LLADIAGGNARRFEIANRGLRMRRRIEGGNDQGCSTLRID